MQELEYSFTSKNEIYNILLLVSRFNGDLYLKQHSTKYLNIANLIKNNIYVLFNKKYYLILILLNINQ